MTTIEFSQGFDTQIAAYNETVPTGEAYKRLEFDEYEKSFFLTKAQDELIVQYYSGRISDLKGFEETEEVRRYLSELVTTANIIELQKGAEPLIPLHKDSHFFVIPEDVWFITYEALKLNESEDKCLSGKFVDVVPVTQDELHRISKNPFRGPNKNRALRLDLEDCRIEIISKYDNIQFYVVRYIKEPSPIILENLSPEVVIKGKNTTTECYLNSVLHQTILDRAVQLAIASRVVSNRN